MRINPAENFVPVLPPVVSAERGEARGTDAPGGPAKSSDSSFTPTAEFTKWLDAARQSPDVRTDVVRDAAARLASGELETPSAAAETAHAALPDLFN